MTGPLAYLSGRSFDLPYFGSGCLYTGIILPEDESVEVGFDGPALGWHMAVTVGHFAHPVSQWVDPFRLVMSFDEGYGEATVTTTTYVPPPTPDYREGFPLACFPADVSVPLPVDESSREAQRSLAGILELLYTDSASAALALQTLMGGGTTVRHSPNGPSLTPGTVIGYNAAQTIVCIAGTSNPEQAAMQVLYGILGIQDFGRYSTNAVWWGASGDLQSRVTTSGAPATTPILLVGHSYGGALAYLMAADYRFFRPDRDISVLTFGAPRPGDSRLAGILTSVSNESIINIGDPVPTVPPSNADIAFLWPLVPAPVLAVWTQFRHPRNLFLLDVDGTLSPLNAEPSSLSQLAQIVAAALLGVPFPAFVQHGITTYRTRIDL